jgi:hypothetical protein
MTFERWELEYTGAGYLLIPRSVAARFFPSDSAVATRRGTEVWLLPTRGNAAGGLLLKQRNAAGDRAVLLAPFLPEDTLAGSWPAIWDDGEGALRIHYRPLQSGAVAAASVVHENGRWVVYLEVGFWEVDDPAAPMKTQRQRINDYPNEESARVAARWIERAADRKLERQPTGF